MSLLRASLPIQTSKPRSVLLLKEKMPASQKSRLAKNKNAKKTRIIVKTKKRRKESGVRKIRIIIDTGEKTILNMSLETARNKSNEIKNQENVSPCRLQRWTCQMTQTSYCRGFTSFHASSRILIAKMDASIKKIYLKSALYLHKHNNCKDRTCEHFKQRGLIM